jgi:hypothetical protein
VSLLEAVRVVVPVAMLGMAAMSAAVVVTSIKEGDSASAWVWVAVFLLTSVMSTLLFWRVV